MYITQIINYLLWPVVVILAYYFSWWAVNAMDKNLKKENES